MKKKTYVKKKKTVRRRAPRVAHPFGLYQLMKNPTPKHLHMPVPNAYETIFRTKVDLYEAAGLSTIASYFVFGNGCSLPYATGTVPPGTLVDAAGTITTKQPAGFSNLVGTAALWQRCHVLSTTIKVTYSPATLSDSLVFGVAPILQTNTTYGSIGSLEQGPRGMTKEVQENTPLGSRSIQMTVDWPKFFGVAPIEYMSDMNFACINGVNPSSQWGSYFQVRRAALNGSTLTVALPYCIELTFRVICHSITTGGLIDI